MNIEHHPTTPLRTVSYGGGVQSTALLVLAARRVIDFPVFLMSNVGDDSEDPRTLDYVRNVAGPYAEQHGIDLQMLHRRKRDGTTETLYGRLMREGSRSVPIPVRMDNGAPGTRSCTADFKIAVIGRWLRKHGAHGGKPCPPHAREDRRERAAQKEAGIAVANRLTPYARRDCTDCTPPNQATVGIGISLDEIHRAAARRVNAWERVVYPLVGLGEETGLKMTRQDCTQLIRSEGLPVPPKSSCYFCPFHRPSAWVELRRTRPDLFDKSVRLEQTLNQRRTMLGKDPVWLTRFAAPLDQVIPEPEALLPGFDVDDTDGSCDTGYCWT